MQAKVEDEPNFCGLLRISKLYCPYIYCARHALFRDSLFVVQFPDYAKMMPFCILMTLNIKAKGEEAVGSVPQCTPSVFTNSATIS